MCGGPDTADAALSESDHPAVTRTAWFHCFSGVSGDMTLGALIDAGADPVAIGRILNTLGIDGWSLDAEHVMRQGLRATLAVVDAPEDHRHHRPYREIREMLERATLPERVRSRALSVFTTLADAEGGLHGVAPDDVEFHEVGALDAIVDVVGVCAALEVLGVDRVVCSPVSVGRGTIHAAHGLLPNPAPAVAAMAAHHSLPLVGLDEPQELATPTGVALMCALSSAFGPLPAGTVMATGLGAGGRNPEHRPNVLQVLISDTDHAEDGGTTETLVELTTNVDDVTGEVLAYTVEELMRAGALDAWVRPISMKKGRPAHTVHVLARAVDVASLREVLMAQTGSLGVRAVSVERLALDRETITVVVGGHEIRVKRSANRVKAEYEDAAAAARSLGRPLRDIQAEAERLAGGK
ncbi:unannotated protein [freshwater metagenome]|uniref:Unannotated protein n=1 Tax=freshwater metagenome TaxID=449393 RepID=A0A6J6X5I9_9ZZZZ